MVTIKNEKYVGYLKNNSWRKSIIIDLFNFSFLMLPCIYILSAYTDWDPLHRYFQISNETYSVQADATREDMNPKKKNAYRVRDIKINLPKNETIELGDADLFTSDGEAKLLAFRYQVIDESGQYGVFIKNISHNSTIIILNNEERGNKIYLPQMEIVDGAKLWVDENELTFNRMFEGLIIEIKYPVLSKKKRFIISKKHLTMYGDSAVPYVECFAEKSFLGKFLDRAVGGLIIPNSQKSKCPNVYIGGNAITSYKIPIPNTFSNSFVIEYLEDNDIYIFRPAGIGKIKLLKEYSVKNSSQEGQNIKDQWVNLTSIVGENRFTLKMGYTSYIGKVKGSTITFDRIIKPTKTTGESLDSKYLSYNDSLQWKPLVNNGSLGFYMGCCLLLFSIVYEKLIFKFSNLLDRNNKYYKIFLVAIPIFILVILFSLRKISYIAEILSFSDIAMFVLLGFSTVVLLSLRNFSFSLHLFLYVSVLFILIGIDYGFSLSFYGNDLIFFADFKIQLLLVGLFIYLGIFLFQKKTRFIVEDFGCYVVSGIEYCWKNNYKAMIGIITFFFVVLCCVQALYGSETGVGGFQPNEFVKLLIGLLIAGVIQISRNWTNLENLRANKRNSIGKVRRNWTFLICFIAVFFTAIELKIYSQPCQLIFYIFSGLLILITWNIYWYVMTKAIWLMLLPFIFVVFLACVVSDFSYLIVIFYSMAIYYIYQFVDNLLEEKSWLKNKGGYGNFLQALILFLLLFIGWFFIISLFSNEIIQKHLHEKTNYGTRIYSWENPRAFSETAYQTLKAFSFTNSEDPIVNNIANMPQIDDDFALTGWLNGYNSFSILNYNFSYIIFSVLALWVFSGCYLIFETRAVRLQGVREGTFIYYLFHLDYFILWGVSITVIHALISISTNLNLLPVMGQPFPFLGRQGSFLLLFQLSFILSVLLIYRNAYNKENFG